MESYYSFHCPNCKTKIIYSNGDPTDFTIADIEKVKCAACNIVLEVPEDIDSDWVVSENQDGWDTEGKICPF